MKSLGETAFVGQFTPLNSAVAIVYLLHEDIVVQREENKGKRFYSEGVSSDKELLKAKAAFTRDLISRGWSVTDICRFTDSAKSTVIWNRAQMKLKE